MKQETKFDLNRAIQDWREGLGQSPAFRSENLYELETHLRDSIAVLQRQGLSDEESFLVALKRIGRSRVLEAEFGKMNRKIVWLDRILWMLIGIQGWTTMAVVYSSAMATTRGIASLTVKLVPEMTAPTFLRLQAGLPFALPAMFLLLFWLTTWLFSRSSRLKRFIPSQPVGLALILFLISAAVKLGSFAGEWYLPKLTWQTVPFPRWELVAAGFMGMLIPAGCLLLVTLIASRHLRTKKRYSD